MPQRDPETLLARVWNDEDDAGGFRARVTYSDRKTAVAATPADLERPIHAWVIERQHRLTGVGEAT
jgi:hypothetical protein